MAAPTFSWNAITSAQTDAESPIDTTLMEGVRQNLVHLKEWLGDSFTPAVDHDHDGINSESVLLADGVVTVAKLNVARGSFGASTGGSFYIPVARYSHLSSLNKTGSVYGVQLLLQTQQQLSTSGEAWEVSVLAQTDNNEYFCVYWDYHTN
jgi:hypothetical protein